MLRLSHIHKMSHKSFEDVVEQHSFPQANLLSVLCHDSWYDHFDLIMGNFASLHLIQICLHLGHKQHKQLLRILKGKARTPKEPHKLSQEVRKLPGASVFTHIIVCVQVAVTHHAMSPVPSLCFPDPLPPPCSSGGNICTHTHTHTGPMYKHVKPRAPSKSIAPAATVTAWLRSWLCNPLILSGAGGLATPVLPSRGRQERQSLPEELHLVLTWKELLSAPWNMKGHQRLISLAWSLRQHVLYKEREKERWMRREREREWKRKTERERNSSSEGQGVVYCTGLMGCRLKMTASPKLRMHWWIYFWPVAWMLSSRTVNALFPHREGCDLHPMAINALYQCAFNLAIH